MLSENFSFTVFFFFVNHVKNVFNCKCSTWKNASVSSRTQANVQGLTCDCSGFLSLHLGVWESET